MTQLDLGLVEDPRQLPLALPCEPDYDRASFVVTPMLQEAVSLVDRWPEWSMPWAVLVGPPGSGKSHLAAIWMARSDAVRLGSRELAQFDPVSLGGACAIVENADIIVAGERSRAVQTGLFHLANHVRQSGSQLLMTARGEPARWPVVISDLASRLRAATRATLPEPDEALLEAVLVKLFADRQIAVDPSLVRYIAERIERSLGMARTVVERLDRQALADGRRIDRRMVAKVLDPV